LLMKRKQLAQNVARTAQVPPAAAQDKVDELVHEILRRLRAGEPVDLEGLGLNPKWMEVRRANGKG